MLYAEWGTKPGIEYLDIALLRLQPFNFDGINFFGDFNKHCSVMAVVAVAWSGRCAFFFVLCFLHCSNIVAVPVEP